jgi:hypothetical protein
MELAIAYVFFSVEIGDFRSNYFKHLTRIEPTYLFVLQSNTCTIHTLKHTHFNI